VKENVISDPTLRLVERQESKIGVS